jgi:hypothetical protein
MKDRGMVKWQPFAALTGHSSYIKEAIDRRMDVEKPILMEDAQEILEHSLCEAIAHNFIVKLKYYKNGKIFEENCRIVTIDTLNKRIYLDVNISLLIDEIIEISI